MLRKIRRSAAILVLALLTAGAAQALPLESRLTIRAPEQAVLSAVWNWLVSLWGGRIESRPAVPETVDGSTAGQTDGSPITKGGGHMDPNG